LILEREWMGGEIAEAAVRDFFGSVEKDWHLESPFKCCFQMLG
jgi:hypothetical protein